MGQASMRKWLRRAGGSRAFALELRDNFRLDRHKKRLERAMISVMERYKDTIISRSYITLVAAAVLERASEMGVADA